jgi:integrase
MKMKGDVRNAKFDIVDAWINNVAFCHSKSENTSYQYRHAFEIFCSFLQKTPEQIVQEYDESTDREFRRRYAGYIRALISSLSQQYAVGTVKFIVAAVRSFFKYNDLPLAHVPSGRKIVTFHNRDISKEEVAEVLRVSRPRDRAFFCMMAQSGLRPETLCSLRLKHIQPDFINGVIPCKIEVPQELAKGKYRSYFTFMGDEAVKYLRDYFKTRPDIDEESFLFVPHGREQRFHRGSMSHVFRRTVNRLRRKGVINFEREGKGKPAEVRLYNLRKWFRKQAHQAGFEIVQFWMGHIVVEGVDEHYRPKDVEFHRKLYAEKAMPFLRIEQATPTETDNVIQKQAEEIEELKRKLAETEDVKRELVDLKVLTKKLMARVEAVEKQAKT